MIFALMTLVTVILIGFIGGTQVVIPLWREEKMFPIFRNTEEDTNLNSNTEKENNNE